MRSCCALALTLLVAARPAHAERTKSLADNLCVDCDKPRPVSAARRALAITAAIVPGFALRGTGSWLVHEDRAAKKLALAAGAGIVLAGSAGALIGLSGANPYTTAAVPLVLGGTGLFVTSWLSDLWVAAGGENVLRFEDQLPTWTLELGSTWLHDAYRERVHGRVAARTTIDRVELRAAALVDTGGDGWLAFGDARVRVRGHRDGSRLWVGTGGRVQRDDDDRVTQLVGELEVGGRLDLEVIDRPLRALFAELSLGLGLVRARYVDRATDVDSIMLGRFAWGVYLPGGELSLYYDHRRDGLAGGIAAYRAAGFVGSVGAVADVCIAGPWAARGELQIGNAWLTTLGLVLRGGAPCWRPFVAR